MWQVPLSLMLLLTLLSATHALSITETGVLKRQTRRCTTTTSTLLRLASIEETHEHQYIFWNRRNVLQTATMAAATVGSVLSTTNTTSAHAAMIADASSANNSIQPIATLSDGVTKFPLASFGLQIYSDEKAYELTLLALQVGYRNFFASVLAGNQKGFARAVRDSGLARSDIFICGSVVSNRASGFQQAYDSTNAGCQRNMAAFAVGGIDYLDQIMLDYPGPDAASIQGQWSAFQTMQSQGLTKTLSVSNFSPAQLDAILKPNGTTIGDSKYKVQVKPVVNQLPFSVAYHPDATAVLAENKQRGVLVQAWAPLGGSLGGRFNARMQNFCAEIGRKHGNKSYAQVALRWIVQNGAAFTTQSQNKQHFQQDVDIFDFELSSQDMALLSSLA
jgi:diketogulonate reductase-like aldo/keto reductase